MIFYFESGTWKYWKIQISSRFQCMDLNPDPDFIQNSSQYIRPDDVRWPQSTPPGKEGRRVSVDGCPGVHSMSGSFPTKWSRPPACLLPTLFHLIINGAPGGPGMMGWGEMGSEDYYGILTSVFSFRASGTAVRQNGSVQTIIFAALLNIQLLSARDIIDLLN